MTIPLILIFFLTFVLELQHIREIYMVTMGHSRDIVYIMGDVCMSEYKRINTFIMHGIHVIMPISVPLLQ